MAKLIFLDTETTGVDPQHAEIIECAYSIDNVMRNELFSPNSHANQMNGHNIIPYEVTCVNNIRDEDVQFCDRFGESKMCNDLKSYAEQGYTIVCHNTDFDCAMLERYGINFNNKMCTLKIAQYYLPDMANHKLGTLHAYLCKKLEGQAHRASYDVEMLIQVFNEINKTIIPDIELSTANEIATQAAWDKRVNVWGFGKYKGQRLDPNSNDQSSYVNWLLKQPEDPKYPRDKEFYKNIKKIFNIV